MKKLIFFTIIILTVSCDPEAMENYVIDNQTAHDINFTFIVRSWSNGEPEKHEILIRSNNSAYLFQNGTIMAFLPHEGDDFLAAFDTIISKINDTLTLKKEINSYINWDFNSVKDRNTKNNCYIFTIEESDLELIE